MTDTGNRMYFLSPVLKYSKYIGLLIIMNRNRIQHCFLSNTTFMLMEKLFGNQGNEVGMLKNTAHTPHSFAYRVKKRPRMFPL